MSKITRRSYKRKKIIMGASLFGAIGLVSTGFAAWVLSAPAVQEQTSSLSVGTVSDKNMKFENVTIYKTGDGTKTYDDTFHFEPLESDTTGRVRYDGTNSESLSLTVAGQLKHVQNLGEINATITVGLKKSDLDTAIDTGYVVAPAAYKATENTPAVTLWNNQGATTSLFAATVDEETDKTMTFTYEVKFTWGSFFDGQNPGEYFDGAGSSIPQGSLSSPVTENSVGGHLNNLHALLDGIQLTLTLTANPN